MPDWRSSRKDPFSCCTFSGLEGAFAGTVSTVTTLITTTSGDVGVPLPRITRVQAEAVRAAADAALATGTRRVYASSWRTWQVWCDLHGHTPLPAHPLTIATWVTERAAEGRSVSTLTKDLAALRFHHEYAGHDDPTASRDLRVVLRGLRRTLGTAPRRQAHALVTDEVRRVVGQIDRTTMRGKRDAALILMGFAAALRRSELAGLDVDDLVFSARGLVVTLRRSKSDQEGHGVVVGVVRGQHPDTDPVKAVRDWTKAADLTAGDALFQRIGRGSNRVMDRRLSGQSVGAIIRDRARAAGLDDLNVSGHSLRAGHATQAAEAGVAALRIARTTRHARLETLGRYVRPAEVLSDTTSGDLGL